MFTSRKLSLLATCLVVSGLLSTMAAPSAEAAGPITYTYSVATRGAIRSDVTDFAARAQGTYDDQRGWGLGGSIRFVRGPDRWELHAVAGRGGPAPLVLVWLLLDVQLPGRAGRRHQR